MFVKQNEKKLGKRIDRIPRQEHGSPEGLRLAGQRQGAAQYRRACHDHEQQAGVFMS
jgi:hypothetical protein